MRSTLIAVCAFLWLNNANAQTETLPATTARFMAFDLSQLGKKIDLKSIGNYAIIKPADSVSYSYHKELLKYMLSNLSGNGIDQKRRIVYYNDENDTFRVSAFLLPVSDQKKAAKAVEAWSSRITFAENRPAKSSNKAGNWFLHAENQFGCGISKNMMLVMLGPYAYYNEYEDDYERRREEDSVKAIIDSIRWSKPIVTPDPESDETGDEVAVDDYFDYDSDSLMVAYRSWREKQNILRRARFFETQGNAYRSYMERLLGLKGSPESLIAKRPEINSEFAPGSDVFHWVDFTGMLGEMAEDASSYRSYNDSTGYFSRTEVKQAYDNTAIGRFFGKLHIYGNGVFEQGSVSLNYRMSGSDSLKPYVARAMDSNVDKSLFDIIKNGEVSFFMSQHTDFTTLTDFYFKTFDKMWQTHRQAVPPGTETREEPYAWLLAATSMYYNMLDKNMLQHTFSGDMLAAVTGVTNFRRTYYSYDIDEEGEYRRIKKTDNTEIPAIVAALGLENRANLEKLLEPWVKYEILQRQSNNVYRLRNIAELSMPPIYLVIQDKAVIITNDSVYTNKDWLARPGGLPAELVTAASSRGSYMRTDGQATGKLLSGMSGISPAALVQTGKLTESIRQMESTGSAVNGEMSFTTRLEFANKSRSGLLELMDLTEVLLK